MVRAETTSAFYFLRLFTNKLYNYMKADLNAFFLLYNLFALKKHCFHVTNIFMGEEEDLSLQTLILNTTLVSNNVVITWNIVNM